MLSGTGRGAAGYSGFVRQFVRLCLTLHLRNFFEKKFLKNLQKTLKSGVSCSHAVFLIPDAFGHGFASESMTPLTLFGTGRGATKYSGFVQ